MEQTLNRLSAQFASRQTEEAYQKFIRDGDRENNLRVLLVALPIFPLYSYFDYLYLADPSIAIFMRIAATAACAVLLLGFKTGNGGRRHQELTTAVVLVLGLTVNGVNFLFGESHHSYYVGLVQGCVFVCFLLRVSFPKTVFLMMSFLVVFAVSVHVKPDFRDASVQTMELFMMVLVCSIGCYLIQRFRRQDFEKTLIIEDQNAQLNVLLDDVRRDNQRKLAAMNTLVHFIKTPLHQISGFSDVVMKNLSRADDDGRAIGEGVEGAQYIKDAAVNLSKSVNGLLTYHRIDEVDGAPARDVVSIDAMIEDFRDFLSEDIAITVDGKAGEIVSHQAVLRPAMQCLAEHYKSQGEDLTTVTLSIADGGGVLVLTLEDDGPEIDRDAFEQDVKPLTKLDKYISNNGAEIPMNLRTVSRCAEICGGALRLEAREEGGNRLVLSFADWGDSDVRMRAAS
ncbi:MAG: hypothetical protein AAGA09_09475 [Pseudomonadota bacterium]